MTCCAVTRTFPVATTYPVSDRASLDRSVAQRSRRANWPGAGFAAAAHPRGATKVRDADQAWHWISYWNTMRGVPGRALHALRIPAGPRLQRPGNSGPEGRLVLIKMCERLSYLNATQNAEAGWAPRAGARQDRLGAGGHRGVRGRDARGRPCAPTASYFFDLKENEAGTACVTEINASPLRDEHGLSTT